MSRLGGWIAVVSCGFLTVGASGADEVSPWAVVDTEQLAGRAAGGEMVRASAFQAWHLDRNAIATALATAPVEGRGGVAAVGLKLALPLPDGTTQLFRVTESSIMEPPLAAKYPQIKTYLVEGVGDRGSHGRIDLTPKGFHAMLRTSQGRIFVDPLERNGGNDLYASYFARDTIARDVQFSCGTPQLPVVKDGLSGSVASVTASGDTLHTYRLALAATGEYTMFHGGTIADGMAAIVTAMNRVNMIYESEVSVRMILVANNDQIVYKNPNSDPYTNNDGFAMLSENQTNLNAVIGSANYDIGHVFSTGGGGVASLRAVCRFDKAQGVTGLPAPVGDAFYIDFVAHEMGHQFGANHSFNGTTGNCCCGNRNGGTAYEPGSGSTIMAYAGICDSDNLQPHSDPDFHSVSLDEIISFINSPFTGGSCDVTSSTGNTLPVVDAGPNFAIPARTPFVLTATGSDADNDVLTYDWEQRDLGSAQTLLSGDNGRSPLFRSWPATTDPSRTFPRIQDLVDNTFSPGERLPVLSRGMDFRVIARDNRAGGGGVTTSDMVVTVVDSAGPFRVVFPNSPVNVAGQTTVQWDIAGTDLPPISAAAVNILLSTDGGFTYPFVLASATPNDGEELVTLPDVVSNTARIKVAAAGNIFFDISDADFTLVSCASVPSPLNEAVPIAKSRFLSISPGGDGLTKAFRVTLTGLPAAFASFEGQTRWVGPPQTYTDTLVPQTEIVVSQLQCQPYFSDWAGIDVLQLFGPEILPGAVYDVQSVACDTTVESNYSLPLVMTTGVWADVAPPFEPDAPGTQPNVLDITAVVDSVKQTPFSRSRTFTQLQPNTVDPSHNPGVLDVTVAVDAVKDVAYPFSGPVACP